MEKCVPCVGPHAAAEEECEEEGATETTHNELTATSTCHHPVQLRGRKHRSGE